MNLCDTSFLLIALFHAASDHGLKNIEVQQCLSPLRMAILVMQSVVWMISCSMKYEKYSPYG